MMQNRRRMMLYTSSAITIMGVSHNTASSSPALTRLGAAVGKSAVAGIGATAQVSDFDNMPIYKDIKLCNLATDGTVKAYYGEAGFSRTGSNGKVMVEIPKFWYKVEVSNGVESWWIANGPANGFALHPAFNRGATGYNDLPFIYVAAYETTHHEEWSVSGSNLWTGMYRSLARSEIKDKLGGRWMQLDIATVMAINLLMYIEYANLNLQTAIAPGRIIASSMATSGFTDGMAGHTGRASGTATEACMKWRHIENWWGNTLTFVDGLNITNYAYYFCLLPSNFADDTTTNYTYAGYNGPPYISQTNHYIKTMGLNAAQPWFRLPTTDGGSATTYYCDVVFTSSGWRISYFGGWYGSDSTDDYGLFWGPSSWNVSWGSDAYYDALGCRLAYLPVG